MNEKQKGFNIRVQSQRQRSLKHNYFICDSGSDKKYTLNFVNENISFRFIILIKYKCTMNYHGTQSK